MIECKLEKAIAILSDNNGYALELNLISFNGKPAKYDLRKWFTATEPPKMLKGVTLTVDELKVLKDTLNSMKELQ